MAPSETIYVYDLLDLPPALRAPVPRGSPIEACLFYVARGGSPAIQALFAGVPEPAVPHVDEGVGVARAVCAVLRKGRLLDALGSETSDAVGFHGGDRGSAERALIAAGATLLPLAPLLNAVALLTLEVEPMIGAHDVVVERWARGGTIRFSPLVAIAPTTVIAVPLPDTPLEAWTLIDGAGRHAPALPLRAGGSHHQKLSLPALSASSAADAAQAAAIVAAVYAEPVAGVALTSSVVVGDVVDDHAVVTVAWQNAGGVFARLRDDVRLLSPRTAFDADRYRACITGGRLALAQAAGVRPGDVVPLALYDDLHLDDVAAFAAAAATPTSGGGDSSNAVTSWAASVGRVGRAEWLSLGVAAEIEVLGLLSPVWARDAHRFGIDDEAIFAAHDNVFAGVADAGPLLSAMVVIWARWLLGDEVDAHTGRLGERVLQRSPLGPETVGRLVDEVLGDIARATPTPQ